MYFLAIRHLISRRKQTIMTLVGIVFGTAAFIIVSGFMLGFRYYLIDQLVNNDAHIRISVREEFLNRHSLDDSLFKDVAHIFWGTPPSGRKDNAKIEYPQGWFRRIEADPRVEAYSPQLTAQAILAQAKASVNVNLIGCDPVKQSRVTNIRSYMTQGRFEEIGQGGNRLIVGEGVLEKIGARLGESVRVSTGKTSPIPFKIVGTYKIGIKNLDEATAYGALSDVQKINQTPSQITDIAVRLTDAAGARGVADSWALTTKEKVQSWDQINANFFSIFKIQDFMRYMMTVSILVVAGFGIYNILNMVVNQKKKEIAILRSMGYESADITTLFLIQGIILGCVGGVFGLILGFLACFRMQFISFSGGPMGSGTGHLMISFDPTIYISGFFLAFAAAVVASYLPARAAGKLAPIEIIRAGAE